MSDSGIILTGRTGDQLLDADIFLRNGQRILRPRVDLGSIVQDSSFLGAFGGLITQEETPIPNMQISFPYNINNVYSRVVTAGGGTVIQASSQAVLEVATNLVQSAQLESIGSARYSPGQGQTVRFTATFFVGVLNLDQEAGVGDLADGFFFGYVDQAFGIIRRQNSVDDFIPQASWNVDVMDGTGPSGMTLDTTLGNVYTIRYQWLGFGAIRFFIEDEDTGLPQLVHVIQYANANITPSVFNPSLPLHARISNTDAGGVGLTAQLKIGSMGAYAEGPINQSGGRFSTGNRKTAITVETNIISIRCDATVFTGQTNRGRVKLDALSAAISGGADAQVRLVLNATLGGAPVFNAIDAARSIVSFDVAGTTVTGGREIRRIASTGNFQETQDFSDLNIRLNPGDVLTLSASSFGAAVAANVCPAWVEEL